MRVVLVVVLSAVAVLLAAATAHAASGDVRRYALVVGNDAGDVDEVRLRYAQADAVRLASVLLELGGVAPEDLILVEGANVEAVRGALIALNERIRTQPPGDSFLVVYYSGHADAGALHLGRTSFPLRELEQLVRGSPATFRMLILDSCRSGALTRVKGGEPAPPYPVELGVQLPSEGVVFWTASAASEDAQESDDVKGSFFTHFLVSGLAGPADRDGDGQVTVAEAYQYAHDATLRASSRTLAGTQHPTYRYEVQGRADLPLTSPGRVGKDRATLSFQQGHDFLIVAENSDGAVVGEVGAHDGVRRLSVKGGRYFVRARGERYLLEGTVSVRPGEEHLVRDGELERFEYARLVRKGGAAARDDGLEVGYAVRTPLWPNGGLCQGPSLGWSLAFAWLSITPRIAYCRETFGNDFLTGETDEVSGVVRVAHAWDVRRISIAAQVDAGVALLHQGFTSAGMAPDRVSLAALFGVGLALSGDVGRGFYLGGDVGATSYVMRRETGGEASVALRLGLVIGKHW